MTRHHASNNQPIQHRIELGWLITHQLSDRNLAAVTASRDYMTDYLVKKFPQFEWHMPVVRRSEPIRQRFIESSQLLVEGAEERDIRHWDFAFVITRADLQSYYKPFALAVSSRAVSVAVLSLARLLPEFDNDDTAGRGGQAKIANRLCSLGMHLLGNLNGLPHSTDATDYMFEPAGPDDLDAMTDFSETRRCQLTAELLQVADIRLEERPASARSGTLRFYLKAAWIGRGDIASAIIQAKPWEFPFRLSRLTAAALSALLILLITAEVWDLGMNQSPLFVGILSLASLLGTSLFVLKRQNLFLRRGKRQLTEQTVFTNISTALVVLFGMTTTYLLLFGLAVVIGGSIFPPRLVQEWAASLPQAVGWPDYLVLAGFVASLGILIGALGASFEGNPYFRHITFVDEEI